jgi:Icc-related predicted phosphoesterase
LKIVAISDTHNKHYLLSLPKGDMIIHGGDVSLRGKRREVIKFLDWFSRLDYKYKIFIAGNHDFLFEDHNLITEILKDYPQLIYLNDSGVEIEGIKIWGSPIQPYFHNWAFNRIGTSIIKHWDLIPNDTNILITHGPPFGILDKTTRGAEVGCPFLLEKVNIVKPKFHIFGHIHESQGDVVENGIHFINASVLDFNHNLINQPIIFEYN